MALSHKDWELPNSRIWLAETDIDRGLDFPLLYGKLRERARWTKSCAVIGYPSGQDGAILPARDFPLYPASKLSPKAIL